MNLHRAVPRSGYCMREAPASIDLQCYGSWWFYFGQRIVWAARCIGPFAR
jgi:hypothetical protein